MKSIRSSLVVLALALVGTACDVARQDQTQVSSAAERCSSCHGYPPPRFVTNATSHPDSTLCWLCHGTTVDESGNIIQGGTHMNGRVDTSVHEMPFLAKHTAAGVADLNACKSCHGTDFAGGESGVSCTACHAAEGFADWQSNCTFCHGTRTAAWTRTAASLRLVAPPRGSHGETLASQPAVGAHQKHLGAGTMVRALDCTECHAVPAAADLTHVGAPVVPAFGPLASQGGLAPAYSGGSCSATYCHGTTLSGGANTTPTWTGAIACGDCHGSPPSTGKHQIPGHAGQSCFKCHALVAVDGATLAIQNTPTALSLHVNGVKDVTLSVGGLWDGTAKTCNTVQCHATTPFLRSW